jgi:thiaminase
MTHMMVLSVHFARLLTATALSLRAAYVEPSFVVSVLKAKLKASNFQHYLPCY